MFTTLPSDVTASEKMLIELLQSSFSVKVGEGSHYSLKARTFSLNTKQIRTDQKIRNFIVLSNMKQRFNKKQGYAWLILLQRDIYFQIETKNLTSVVRTTDITKDERDEQTWVTRRLEDERRRRGGVVVVLMEFMYLISRFFLVVGLFWACFDS